MTSLPLPASFPVGGRRLVVYVVWDRRGGVEDFVPFALAGLREHAARVLVVVNGSLSEEGRAKLEPVSDEILVRSNAGFDIWAHKDALDHVGDAIGEFDEVLLTNDTWFGPVRPYGPVFDRMGERAVHFWGMTDHVRQEPNPFTGKGVLPYHLQSFWIAVRREMFLSEAWRRYWAELPEMPTYFDAVLKHEAVFTETFAQDGFTHDVAFPESDHPTEHPALFNPDLLVEDGCPLVKRRPLFHYPPFMNRHAVSGRRIVETMSAYGYPAELVWSNLARNVQPKVLNTDAGMLEVLPDRALADEPETAPRLAVIAHLPQTKDVPRVVGALRSVPHPFDLFVTVHDAGIEPELREAIRAVDPAGLAETEVRVVPEHGRDMSALLIGCRDVLTDGRYDLVIKVHGRTPRQRSQNARRYFSRYQLENLLSSPGYVRNVLALFDREPGLGLVYPPMMHVGYSLPGRAWSFYLPRAKQICEDAGIQVPLDGISPLAPYGGMWIGRPSALRRLLDMGFTFADYERPRSKSVPALTKVIERLVSYAAAEDGYHTRTILTGEHASISHTSMEYKVDQLASTTPGYPLEQVQFMHRAGWMGTGGAVAMTRMYMRINHPDLARRLHPVLHPVGRVVRVGLRTAKATLRRARTLIKGGRDD
ncbi:rhamnan synthesis F family protein [Microbacterium sp. MYb64]|uniref:rhamnan synthesis F family protein n=1 Tax=Microbacterium sp. MYb64 TaxID=1848691 RepID=UPI00215882EF|nr:rhamnan synthesis F family protein [Microbacterium sp. MYb64]